MFNTTGIFRINEHLQLPKTRRLLIELKIKSDITNQQRHEGWESSFLEQVIKQMKYFWFKENNVKVCLKHHFLLLNNANQMLLFKQDIQVTVTFLSQSNLRTPLIITIQGTIDH